MSRSAAFLATCTLAAAMLVSPASHAVHPGSCPQAPPGAPPTWTPRWTTAGSSCQFALQGAPVRAFGTAETSAGTAWVRVSVTVDSPVGPQTILSCYDAGPRFATVTDCEIGAGQNINWFVQNVPLTCRVSGSGGPAWGCSAFLGEWIPEP